MSEPEHTIYVIPGSHACRSGMLMLEHKGIPYKRVEFITLTHPMMSRLHGFNAGGETRTAGGKKTLGLRLGDWLGTVPGLAAGKDRVSTNHAIARYLEEHHPDPPLFPTDPEQRAAVEEAEAWANETLQMAARRVLGAAAARNPEAVGEMTADGRLGHLLYKRSWARRLVIPRILTGIFRADERADEQILAELPPMLDKIDAWIEQGVVGGEQLNAADCMIAPSLALMLYRPDIKPMFEGRPALELVDRMLPEPVQGTLLT